MIVRILRPFFFNGKYYEAGKECQGDDLRCSPKYYQVIGFDVEQKAVNQARDIPVARKRKRAK